MRDSRHLHRRRDNTAGVSFIRKEDRRWEDKVSLTIGVGVVAAHTQPLSVSLDVFVIKFDPQGPAQVRLSHRVLQPPPCVCKPVGHLHRHHVRQQQLSSLSVKTGAGLTCTRVMCEPRASSTFSVLVG